MKKHLLALLALSLMGVGSAFAQSEIHTYSVYDVNHDATITVDDVTTVVNHALKANAESPQTVDAAALNALLQSIDNRLARIEEKLGIVSAPEEGPEEEHEWVDLGLPSGTLWATCNVGADNPEDYGHYFAWGEVEPKSTYNRDTYFDSVNGSSSNFKKYYNGGGKTELDLEDDAAYMNWGEGWRMPSFEQIQELYNSNYVKTEWVNQEGKNGRLITSKSNGASLFLPAAGYRNEGSLFSAGSWGGYWSRSLFTNDSNYACCLDFSSSGIDWYGSGRCYGFSVRPVRVSSQN